MQLVVSDSRCQNGLTDSASSHFTDLYNLYRSRLKCPALIYVDSNHFWDHFFCKVFFIELLIDWWSRCPQDIAKYICLSNNVAFEKTESDTGRPPRDGEP